MTVASCRKTFGHEGTAKCCKMTPVFCVLCVFTLRCQECKSLYVRKKTTCYQWGRTVPVLVTSAIKKHHRKQDAAARGRADTSTACPTWWSLPPPWQGREVLLQQPGKPPRDSYLYEHIPGNALCLCPLLLPCCCCAGFHRCSSQEKAAAALNLLVSISPVVWLHPSVMELLIVPPFPNPSCCKDWAVVIRGRGIILCLFLPFFLSPGCVAIPLLSFPSVSEPCFLNNL